MARTDCPVTDLVRYGKGIGTQGTEVSGDNVNNHKFVNDGRTVLICRVNATAANSITFKIPSPVNTVAGQVVTNPVGTAGLIDTSAKHCIFGPFEPGIFNQTAASADTPGEAGNVYFDVNNTNLRLQAVRLP